MSESFQRWQDKTIEQSNAFATTVMTLSLGAIAFILTTLDHENKALLETVSPIWMRISLLGFGGAIAGAILGMASRLHDFRRTAEIARIREKKFITAGDKNKMDEIRKEAKGAGRRTWIYLHMELIAFGVGVFCLVGHTLNLYPVLIR